MIQKKYIKKPIDDEPLTGEELLTGLMGDLMDTIEQDFLSQINEEKMEMVKEQLSKEPFIINLMDAIEEFEVENDV